MVVFLRGPNLWNINVFRGHFILSSVHICGISSYLVNHLQHLHDNCPIFRGKLCGMKSFMRKSISLSLYPEAFLEYNSSLPNLTNLHRFVVCFDIRRNAFQKFLQIPCQTSNFLPNLSEHLFNISFNRIC